MLPNVPLSNEQLQELLSFAYIGDVCEKSAAIAMDHFRKLQEDKSGYALPGVANDTLQNAIMGMNLQGIPFDRQQQYLGIASDYQQCKRAIIAQVVGNPANKLGLEEQEQIVIKAFLSMASLFDQLFIAWRDVVVYSELGRKLAADPSLATEFRKEHNLLTVPYVFSVVKEKDGVYYEESLIKAFPVLVGRIVEELTKLSQELLMKDGDVEMIDFLNAFVDFYLNEDPEKYEYYSKTLDGLFVKLPGRVIPRNPMEVYEDPGKYCVSQEFDLAFIDDRYDNVNKGIEHTRVSMMDILQKEYGDVPALQASLPLMQKAKAAAYVKVVEAGACLTLRPFGENIPNWEEVRFSEGVRIFIMMETAKTRWVGERMVLAKLLGEEQVAKIYDPHIQNGQYYNSAGIVAVGGHEIAHNAFVTEDVQARLTPPLYAKVEEHKANMTILSNIDKIYDEEEQKIIALYEFAYSLVKMREADNQVVVAYVNYALFAMNAFFASGMLTKQDGQYVLDTSSDKVGAWVRLLKPAFTDLVAIYDHGNAEDLQKYMEKYFARTEDIDAVIKLVAEV